RSALLGRGRGGGVRRRRAVGGVPVAGRELPRHRRGGRGARPLRRLSRARGSPPASIVAMAQPFDDPRAMTWLRRAVAFVLVAGLVACAEGAGTGPAGPAVL